MKPLRARVLPKTTRVAYALCLLALLAPGVLRADCASAPATQYLHLEYPGNGNTDILTNQIQVDGCNYVLDQQGASICWTPTQDDGIVKCTFLMEQGGDVGGGTDTQGYLVSDDSPALGCGYISGDFGTTSFCAYDGEYDVLEDEQEIPIGWRDEGGKALPGHIESDIQTVDTQADTGCPDDYTLLPDSDVLCITDEKYSHYSWYHNPNTSTSAEGSGDPNEPPSEGIDICVEHPNILACQNESILDETGADYNEDDYQAGLDDALDLPSVTLDPGDFLLSSDGSCQTINLEFWGEAITFPNAYVCDLFEIGRTIAAFVFYLLTALGVFFIIIRKPV